MENILNSVEDNRYRTVLTANVVIVFILLLALLCSYIKRKTKSSEDIEMLVKMM